MRVKLSYTVDEDAVLSEAAKLLNLSTDDMQYSIKMFTDVQAELKGSSSEDGIVNVQRAREMIEEFRETLLKVDTRLMEVSEIVVGYDEYRSLPPKDVSARSPQYPTLDEPELFGAD